MYNGDVELSTLIKKRILKLVNRYERFTGIISEIHRHLIKISSDEMKKYGLHGTSARILLAFQTCGSMTAAATTGPQSGPLPASSHPQTAV